MAGGYGNNSTGWGDPFVPVSDPFDALLSNLCAIYRATGGNINKYGHCDLTPFLIQDGIPCRLSALGGRSPTPGQEFVLAKQIAKVDLKIFMRPQAFEITSANSVVLESRWFNITSVLAERGRDNTVVHHLELFVEEVYPSTFTPPPPLSRA